VAFVQEIGFNHRNSGNNTVPVTVPALGVALGNTVVVLLGWNSTTNDPTGITDSKGNTYTMDKAITDTHTSTKKITIWSAPVTTALVSGDTITATWVSGPSRSAMIAIEVAGIIASGAIDVTASNTSASSATLDGGSVATTVAVEFWIEAALQSIGNSTSFTLTADGLWTALPTESTSSGSTNIGLGVEYKSVVATGTMNPAPTSSLTVAYAACCVAYKVTAGGPTNTVLPAVTGNAWVGQTLSCTSGTWTGSGTITYAYQWRNAGVPIGGATNSTYVLQAGDVGFAITCRVTATDNTGSTAATSNSVTAGPSYTATANMKVELCAFATVVYTPGGNPSAGRYRKRGSQRLSRFAYRYAIYPRG
jgi:hypothetical protein